jgi:hypothetical protein
VREDTAVDEPPNPESPFRQFEDRPSGSARPPPAFRRGHGVRAHPTTRVRNQHRLGQLSIRRRQVWSTGTFAGFLAGDPLAVFPPLYPFLLGPGEALDAPFAAARILGAVVFGLLVAAGAI